MLALRLSLQRVAAHTVEALYLVEVLLALREDERSVAADVLAAVELDVTGLSRPPAAATAGLRRLLRNLLGLGRPLLCEANEADEDWLPITGRLARGLLEKLWPAATAATFSGTTH